MVNRQPSPRDPCNSGPAGLLRRPIKADNAAMEAEPTKAEPVRNRRRFQFRLRMLMIVVTVLVVSNESEWRMNGEHPPVQRWG